MKPFQQGRTQRRWKRRIPDLAQAPATTPSGAPLAAAPEVDEGDGKIRLNRFLAMAGIASRRACDSLIAAGEVRINGRVVRELGTKVDGVHDLVEVQGQELKRERPTYVLLNKPAGVVCTSARHEQKTRAIDLCAHIRGRLFCVGRLDEDSEGLILLTNDGEFANRVSHPRYEVPKTYGVLVKGRMEHDDVDKAKGGVWLSEGRTGRFQVMIKRRSPDRTYLLVKIKEGKNREVRRLFARLGFPVVELKRLRIGSLTLHGLKPGKCRFLTPGEVQKLMTGVHDEEFGE